MLIFVTYNQQQYDIELDQLDYVSIHSAIMEQLKIDFEFKLQYNDGTDVTEIIDQSHLIVVAIPEANQMVEPKENQGKLKKFKSFLTEAPSKIKEKTLNGTKQFKRSITMKEQKPDQQESLNTEQPHNSPQHHEKVDDSDEIPQQPSSHTDNQEQQSPKIVTKPLETKPRTNPKSQRISNHHNNLKEQSNTQYVDTTFGIADEYSEQKKIEKRQKIAQRIEEDKLQKEKNTKLQQNGNKLIKQIQDRIKTKEYLIKQKEEQLMLPELEKRKAVLAQKRELSQPIRLDQLAEHQKKYQDEKKMKELERDLQKQEQENEFKAKLHKFPKSHAQLRLEEEQRHLKQMRQEEQDQKKLARQRQLKYADVAQELYFKEHPRKIKPNSPNKEEIANQIREVHVNDLNLKKLQRVLGKNDRHQSQDSKESLQHQSFHQENRPPRPKIKKLDKIPQKAEELPPKPKTTDYLQQLKQSRKNPVPVEEQWEKIIENKQIGQDKKYMDVLNNVQKLEQKAKEKEKIGQLNQDQSAEEEANNLYIASIKAKLALLDNN